MIEHRRVGLIWGVYALLVAAIYGGIVVWGRSGAALGEHVWWAFDHLAVEASQAGFAVVIGLLLSLIGWAVLRLYVDPPARWVRWAVLAGAILGAGALTWYVRVERSFGDRTIFLEMLTHGKLFRMSQPLTTALYGLAYRWVQELGWPPRNAVALVCSIAAMALVWPFLELLRGLPRDERSWTAVLVCSSTLGVLFFGYVETTVVALTLALVYTWVARLYVQGRVRLWMPALVLGFAVAAHGMSLYLFPSLFVLALYQTEKTGSRSRLVSWIGAGIAYMLPILIVIGMALLSRSMIRGSILGDSFGGTDMRPFVALSIPQPPNERYTLFSLAHVLDLVNLAFLVSPFVFMVVGVSLFGFRLSACTVWECFLFVGAASGLLYAFLWNADLGMKQDWDLFAPALLPVLLLGGRLIATRTSKVLRWGMAVLSLYNSVLFLRVFEPTCIWSPLLSAVPNPVVQQPTNLVWPDHFELVGLDGQYEQVSPGETITYTLYFRGLDLMKIGYTPFLHLIDERGNLIAQDDHQPHPPTEYWAPGEIVTDTFSLSVPPDISVSPNARLYIGTYFWQTLERLPLLQDGQPAQDNVAILAEMTIRQ